ncbi:hypothetical protein C8F04DRAFT_1190507 [Mycena alexandri]|uniref:Uncharacterized protein n=1 Tax=Mycena alexandri TaxID=1745969 RepID=A0AAD6SF20_9AGAR|nr:hypothetical protein C8F04DRAFT_1190507 [Mycena alexandri]
MARVANKSKAKHTSSLRHSAFSYHAGSQRNTALVEDNTILLSRRIPTEHDFGRRQHHYGGNQSREPVPAHEQESVRTGSQRNTISVEDNTITVVIEVDSPVPAPPHIIFRFEFVLKESIKAKMLAPKTPKRGGPRVHTHRHQPLRSNRTRKARLPSDLSDLSSSESEPEESLAILQKKNQKPSPPRIHGWKFHPGLGLGLVTCRRRICLAGDPADAPTCGTEERTNANDSCGRLLKHAGKEPNKIVPTATSTHT